ncbi:MAG: anaerobic ribonucleoside-triphosphate reductase activating protein [Megasphaera sp.]|jgi:anaerobic ribonucleoside-triphosphate reductase activating protein|nr:anaerobic ribonucleoside-triphosphate reductase activating protein [Megasphaera sp.]MCI1248151.1 anaerobic ribonucleoside-triphosphate reductase activating protein [Megasphaera sp.]
MNYGQIRQFDIANGTGIRATVFVTGCDRHCPNCFNPEYQDFHGGKTWTDAETATVISYVQAPTNSGVTFLGGEPMQNTEGLTALAKKIRRAVPEKDIWVYSGYSYEEILQDQQKKKLLDECDVLVDGPFVDALKDPGLYFRGSSNQRVIDLKKTRTEGHLVLLWPDGR